MEKMQISKTFLEKNFSLEKTTKNSQVILVVKRNFPNAKLEDLLDTEEEDQP